RNATDAVWLQVCIGKPAGSYSLRPCVPDRLPQKRLDLSATPPIGHHRAMTDGATDPLQSPHGHRNMLLRSLSHDHRAKVQAATVARLRELVAEAGTDLRTRPEPKEW